METARFPFSSLVTVLTLALRATLGETPGWALHLQRQLRRLEGAVERPGRLLTSLLCRKQPVDLMAAV